MNEKGLALWIVMAIVSLAIVGIVAAIVIANSSPAQPDGTCNYPTENCIDDAEDCMCSTNYSCNVSTKECTDGAGNTIAPISHGPGGGTGPGVDCGPIQVSNPGKPVKLQVNCGYAVFDHFGWKSTLKLLSRDQVNGWQVCNVEYDNSEGANTTTYMLIDGIPFDATIYGNGFLVVQAEEDSCEILIYNEDTVSCTDTDNTEYTTTPGGGASHSPGEDRETKGLIELKNKFFEGATEDKCANRILFSEGINNFVRWDPSKTGDSLLEMACIDGKKPGVAVTPCEYGCSGGKCLAEPEDYYAQSPTPTLTLPSPTPPSTPTADLCEVRGMQGITGPDAIPRMLFSWDWSEIELNTCNQLIDAYFCDSTQFSIDLFRRLERSENMWIGADTGEDKSFEFKTYLKKDGFTEDFKKDFAEYYTGEFFGTVPDWFMSDFYKYFEGTEAIEFSPEKISEPGLYKVVIYYKGDTSEGFFTEAGEPEVKITVNFTKEEAEFTDSPLLEMAFDGLVGTTGDNPDRQGYGIVTDSEETLTVAVESPEAIVIIPNIDGTEEVDTAKIDDVSTISFSERSKLMEIGKGGLLGLGNTKIDFYQSQVMDVVMGIDSGEVETGKGFGAFYSILSSDGDPAISEFWPSLTKWRILATSEDIDCKDFFQGGEIDYDNAASSYSETCLGNEDTQSTFGFWWKDPEKKGKLVMLGSFYTPTGDRGSYTLNKVCDDTAFFSACGNISERLDLGSCVYQASSIESIVSNVRSKEVCITNDGKEFYWNEEKFWEEFDARYAVEEAWGTGTYDLELKKCN